MSARYNKFTYWLIHQTEGDLVVVLVLSRNLRPKTSELSIGRTSLSNDRAVPTSVVVDVDNAKGGAGVQATLDLFVVGREVVGVKGAAEVVVQQELPSHRNTEGVQAIVVDKVLHLVDASLAWIDDTRRLARAIDGAAKVESCDLSWHHGQFCSIRRHLL